MEKFMLPCLTKKFLGFDCMGCGLQRSFVLFVKGDFTEAFFMYPAIFPLMILVVVTGAGFFINIKNSNVVIPFLAILTVLTIIISYIFKLTT